MTTIQKLFDDFQGAVGVDKQIYEYPGPGTLHVIPEKWTKAEVQFVRDQVKKAIAAHENYSVDIFGYSRGGPMSVFTAFQLNQPGKIAPGVKGPIKVNFLGLIDPVTTEVNFVGGISRGQLDVPNNVTKGNVWVGIQKLAVDPATIAATVNYGGVKVATMPYGLSHVGLGNATKATQVITDLEAAAAKAGVIWKKA